MEISTLVQPFRLFSNSDFNFLGPGAGRPRELSGPYRAMRAAMQCERRLVIYMEMAMRRDAKILAMRVLAAEILCDAPPRCENTSDVMPRCQPLSPGTHSQLRFQFLGPKGPRIETSVSCTATDLNKIAAG